MMMCLIVTSGETRAEMEPKVGTCAFRHILQVILTVPFFYIKVTEAARAKRPTEAALFFFLQACRRSSSLSIQCWPNKLKAKRFLFGITSSVFGLGCKGDEKPLLQRLYGKNINKNNFIHPSIDSFYLSYAGIVGRDWCLSPAIIKYILQKWQDS